jgi:hypothetical protein
VVALLSPFSHLVIPSMNESYYEEVRVSHGSGYVVYTIVDHRQSHFLRKVRRLEDQGVLFICSLSNLILEQIFVWLGV